MSDPQSKRPSLHRPPSHAVSLNPSSSLCARGFVHSPEKTWKDNTQTSGRPVRRCGPDLPCYPPLSQVSSKFEVDDRRTGGSEIPTSGSASLFKVKHCGRWFPCDLCVARPHTELMYRMRGEECGRRGWGAPCVPHPILPDAGSDSQHEVPVEVPPEGWSE